MARANSRLVSDELCAQPRQVHEEAGIALDNGVCAFDGQAVLGAQRGDGERLHEPVIVVAGYSDAAGNALWTPTDHNGIWQRIEIAASATQLGTQVLDAIALLEAERCHVLKARLALCEAGGCSQDGHTVDDGIPIQACALQFRAASKHQRTWPALRSPGNRRANGV